MPATVAARTSTAALLRKRPSQVRSVNRGAPGRASSATVTLPSKYAMTLLCRCSTAGARSIQSTASPPLAVALPCWITQLPRRIQTSKEPACQWLPAWAVMRTARSCSTAAVAPGRRRERRGGIAECKMQIEKCKLTRAFCILHFSICISHSSLAQSLRGCAATALHANSGPVARQVVSAEEHPCFAGRTGTVPSPLPTKPQNQSRKVVTRKARYFKRRDYKDTRPADQGGLDGIANVATAYPSNGYEATERNLFGR